jgi:spermidine/putrescine transport system ATP-binding protein
VTLRSQSVALDGVTRTFDGVVAVDDVSLEVASGEFFSLLGPSGCGKTTSLRMIAGFERPDAGRIAIGDADVTETPPHRRPVNTVFQSYALFPHLTVEQNVGFGLRFTDIAKDEGRRRVAEILDLVRLGELGKRRPHQLSGGQQQRVALARALVLSPSVLLLDEPLGALDAKLRRGLQVELKTLQREVGITFVYVTHDQEEALTMSDRLAVMHAGSVQQLGTPRDVYEAPATAFVADFLGVSNLMPGTCGGDGRVTVDGVTLEARQGDVAATGDVRLTIRPERVEIEAAGSAPSPNRITVTVTELVYLGSTTQVIVRTENGATLQALLANTGAEPPFGRGDRVVAHLPAEALRVLSATEGQA